MPVPFVMEPKRTAEGEQAFLESLGQKSRMLWAYSAVCAFLAIPMIVYVLLAVMNPFSLFPWTAAGVAVVELGLAVLLVTVANRGRTTARRLIFQNQSLRLAIQIVRSSGNVDSEWVEDIGRCRLTMHPVELRSPTGITFNGWMARVMVGDRCFALACCKEKDEVIAYMHRLPAWLLAISAGEGEKVTGQLSDRRFGNKPMRV